MNWKSSLMGRWKRASILAAATVYSMVPAQAFAQAANQTQVGQKSRAQRTRPQMGEVDDCHSCKRKHCA